MAHSINNQGGPAGSPGVPSKPVKPASKQSSSQGFGTNMPLMSSAFDTAMWLSAA